MANQRLAEVTFLTKPAILSGASSLRTISLLVKEDSDIYYKDTHITYYKELDMLCQNGSNHGKFRSLD
jgi:hypothetical protein